MPDEKDNGDGSLSSEDQRLIQGMQDVYGVELTPEDLEELDELDDLSDVDDGDGEWILDGIVRSGSDSEEVGGLTTTEEFERRRLEREQQEE